MKRSVSDGCTQHTRHVYIPVHLSFFCFAEKILLPKCVLDVRHVTSLCSWFGDPSLPRQADLLFLLFCRCSRNNRGRGLLLLLQKEGHRRSPPIAAAGFLGGHLLRSSSLLLCRRQRHRCLSLYTTFFATGHLFQKPPQVLFTGI